MDCYIGQFYPFHRFFTIESTLLILQIFRLCLFKNDGALLILWIAIFVSASIEASVDTNNQSMKIKSQVMRVGRITRVTLIVRVIRVTLVVRVIRVVRIIIDR